MSNSNDDSKSSAENWTVEHDKTKCALCVVCARNCPTAALRRDEEGDNLALYFNVGLCDGCNGESLCEQNCPESAIRLSKDDSPPSTSDYVLLSQSKMTQCDYCDEYFAPVRRLDVISQKGVSGHEVERSFCPLCRRTNLVVQYIQEKRSPGSKAEYRSARDIVRKANKRMEEERKNS
ncbi:MAG: hypothetical protein GY847_41815 [Proteobacteria bacterium]|nr:hypothetical protein [Pseudomonadota bacterium]